MRVPSMDSTMSMLSIGGGEWRATWTATRRCPALRRCPKAVAGCTLSIREDLLNKYAEKMVNYCTTASNNSLQDALDSSAYLLKEKEQQILQLETELDYVWEKHS